MIQVGAALRRGVRSRRSTVCDAQGSDAQGQPWRGGMAWTTALASWNSVRNVTFRPSRLASRAPGQQQAAERQGVGGDHLLPAGSGEAQRALSGRQCDVHHREVQDHHQLRQADHAQDEHQPRFGRMTAPAMWGRTVPAEPGLPDGIQPPGPGPHPGAGRAQGRAARRVRRLQAHLPGLLRTAAGPTPGRPADPAAGARRGQAGEGPAVQLAAAVSTRPGVSRRAPSPSIKVCDSTKACGGA